MVEEWGKDAGLTELLEPFIYVKRLHMLIPMGP